MTPSEARQLDLFFIQRLLKPKKAGANAINSRLQMELARFTKIQAATHFPP